MESKQYLDDYAYEKIWSELSAGDRNVVRAIAMSISGRVKEVREIAGLSTNQFNPYRDRLVKKGVVDGSAYGPVRCFSRPGPCGVGVAGDVSG